MAQGLLMTGEGYKDEALKGMIQESGEQQKINQENKDLDAQHKNQQTSEIAQGASSAASLALMIHSLMAPAATTAATATTAAVAPVVAAATAEAAVGGTAALAGLAAIP